MSDKKNSNVLVISLVFIFLNATFLFENQIGIVLFLTIYSYLLSQKIFNSYLLEKNSFKKVFRQNFMNYYLSFLVAILSVLFISFFQNPELYAILNTELYYLLTLTLHAKFLSVISFITILLSFNFMLHIVFYLMKKKFKSFNVYFIFLMILAILSIGSSIFLNTQFIYYLPLIVGSLYSFVDSNKIIIKVKVVLRRLRLISIALFILFVVLLYVFRNNILLLTLLSLVLITIENSEYRLFKNNIIQSISGYSYSFILVLYGVIYILVQSFNSETITILLSIIILLITIIFTLVFYYVIYMPLSSNIKFRYFAYFVSLYLVIMSIFMTTLSPPLVQTINAVSYVEEANIISQDVDSLIDITHDTYEASSSNNNLTNKQIYYVGSSNSEMINQTTEAIFKDITTNINDSNNYSNALSILNNYNITEDGVIVLDLDLESLDYNQIINVIEAYPDNNIYLITTKGQDELNTLLVRAEVEYNNVYVIDFAEHSDDNDQNYINNSDELSKIGISNYINYMYSQMNANEGEK